MADYEGQMAGKYSTPHNSTVRRIGINFHLDREILVSMFRKTDFLENRGNPNPTRLDSLPVVPGDSRLESGCGEVAFDFLEPLERPVVFLGKQRVIQIFGVAREIFQEAQSGSADECDGVGGFTLVE